MRLLLIQPPIYDFTAYDFWLKPYGLLQVAGRLRGQAQMALFDFLDRNHPSLTGAKLRRDRWGRGAYPSQEIERPAALADVPRVYRRFGLPRALFQEFLQAQAPFDVALIQTGMTYWYPGVREVIADLRALSPRTAIVLGGVYATLCSEHAAGLGADLVVEAQRLDPLWELLRLRPDDLQPAWWEACDDTDAGVLKLTDGCPYRCTYCAIDRLAPPFRPRPLGRVLAEYDLLCRRGVRNIAFYDDALLLKAEEIVLPFLHAAAGRGVTWHTPNGLHARYLTSELARTLVGSGFRTFYLGFESTDARWLARTGGKLDTEHFDRAVDHLRAAGADSDGITAYLVHGHPAMDADAVARAVTHARHRGVRVMLADFSPIPGTPDGDACRRWTDLGEPLNHNKTAFVYRRYGVDEVNRIKALARGR